MRRRESNEIHRSLILERDGGLRINIPVAAIVLLLLGLNVPGEHRTAVAQDRTTVVGPAVVGVVKFDGPRPKRKPLRLREKGGKLSDCHKLHKTPLLDENLIVSETGEVANVFIYVRKGLEKGKEYPLPKKPAILNQLKCMFQPRVQGVRVGQEFVMKNGDPVLHNVRSFSFRNRAFNVAQPANSEDRKKVFKYREKAVMVQCDIHPWMKAYFFVIDHPSFAVTNAKGQFTIQGLPPGEYTLSAWHEEFGEQQAIIKVGSTGSTKVAFSFKEKEKAK